MRQLPAFAAVAKAKIASVIRCKFIATIEERKKLMAAKLLFKAAIQSFDRFSDCQFCKCAVVQKVLRCLLQF